MLCAHCRPIAARSQFDCSTYVTPNMYTGDTTTCRKRKKCDPTIFTKQQHVRYFECTEAGPITTARFLTTSACDRIVELAEVRVATDPRNQLTHYGVQIQAEANGGWGDEPDSHYEQKTVDLEVSALLRCCHDMQLMSCPSLCRVGCSPNLALVQVYL